MSVGIEFKAELELPSDLYCIVLTLQTKEGDMTFHSLRKFLTKKQAEKVIQKLKMEGGEKE